MSAIRHSHAAVCKGDKLPTSKQLKELRFKIHRHEISREQLQGLLTPAKSVHQVYTIPRLSDERVEECWQLWDEFFPGRGLDLVQALATFFYRDLVMTTQAPPDDLAEQCRRAIFWRSIPEIRFLRRGEKGDHRVLWHTISDDFMALFWPHSDGFSNFWSRSRGEGFRLRYALDATLGKLEPDQLHFGISGRAGELAANGFLDILFYALKLRLGRDDRWQELQPLFRLYHQGTPLLSMNLKRTTAYVAAYDASDVSK